MSQGEHPFASLEKFQRRWAKGQSGNPSGRTKFKSLSKAAREALDKFNPASGLTGAQEVVESLMTQAKRGNVWAAKELREWTEGKVPQVLHAEVETTTTNTTVNVKAVLMAKLTGQQALLEAKEEKETDDEPDTN
jgi:hypothetical protein